MMRIKRRDVLIVFVICMTIFLILYVIINSASTDEDRKPNFNAIEIKLRQLENGLERHGEEMRFLKDKLEYTVHQHRSEDREVNENGRPRLSFEEVEHESSNVIERRDEPSCDFNFQQPPRPDVQMLELYNKIPFKNVAGGAWTQGWNIVYDPLQYNDHHKLKVFVVPHSHNDPGWVKTFDDYYQHQTKHILSNALRHLRENPDMKFIWAEISYFSRFFEDLGENNRKEMKRLVKTGQLEFVSGGWVMPDEANSHWISVLMQLTEGQTWLKQNLNVTPTSSWSIDPFGHSPVMPYILKKSGFQNHLIQRTHYEVKKELASKRQLEFYWRQLWDDAGDTDIFTHMMPFYSYDIPHTCGPDPKICCQFDFKRTPKFGLYCPWRVPPQTITDENVAQRAQMLVDQWKKKAELYRTNTLLIPLGDDFRYVESTEWEVQRINYEALFDHINAEQKYHVVAKFGTLQEYFDAVQKEPSQDFPSLTGDFFTYADREDNYWSGYFTSRPYHKRMDRLLLHYVRAAEMLSAWNYWEPESKFDEGLREARRQLSLFQHHDGITGTAKTHVVRDYTQRMLEAIKTSKFIMQQAVYRLLTKPTVYNPDYSFNYFYMDESQWPGPDDSRTTIILGEDLSSKHVVFHNSLPQWRNEIVDFFVSTPFVSVNDLSGKTLQTQVNPVWSWHKHAESNTVTPQASTTKYRLIFKVKVPPLGLSTYVIRMEASHTQLKQNSFATNLILSTSPISVNLGDYMHEVRFSQHREFSLHLSGGPTLAFSADGMLKSVQLDSLSPPMPTHLKFYKYGTRIEPDNSGAYLFMPNGPATPLVNVEPPVVLVSEGPLEASVSVGLPFVVHQVILRLGADPEIRNMVDIDHFDDTEIAMRISTHIKSGDLFYTDLNGLQMIKRRRFAKIPIQANYYPVPSAMYIEDGKSRLTLVSAQPLGGASLETGELEIMQDRRLKHDDNRGVGQGVEDNQPVLHIFRLVLEKIGECLKPSGTHPMGALTLAAHRASKTLLHPVDKFILTENYWYGVQESFGNDHVALEVDMEVVVMRNLSSTSVHPVAHDRRSNILLTTGIAVHRTALLSCPETRHLSGEWKMSQLLQFGHNMTTVHNSTLTFLQRFHKFSPTELNFMTMCPMDTKAFIVQRRT